MNTGPVIIATSAVTSPDTKNAGTTGQPWSRVRMADVYAPTPNNAPCASDNWPMRNIKFMLMASDAYNATMIATCRANFGCPAANGQSTNTANTRTVANARHGPRRGREESANSPFMLSAPSNRPA